ncbi:MAG TPA: MBL fold metallo-hydrolase [Burkholderiales bacterium]|nr:MBL fold metallo-hydrolase [Burkholderiales bacterium]
MRKDLSLRIAAFTAVILAAPAFAQQDFSKVEIQTEKLADSVYMMTGAGGNLGVSVGEDGVFVIDDQFAPLTGKIQAAITKLSTKPVKFVLNTHWHFDHTGGNENLGKAGTVIVAQENVRKRLSSEGFIEFLGMKTKAEPAIALPVVTFTRDISFQLNGDDIRAVHAPRAHTDGDTVVQFAKSDVIHMGDTFFNGLYPFIDTSSGGTVAGVLAAADRVLKMAGDKTKIIPGHGPLATKADLKAYRDMLAAVSANVAGQVKQGKKLEEVVASKPTAQFDAAWGKGFLAPDKFVEMLYGNLKKK